MIKLKNVYKSYSNIEVLKNVNLSFGSKGLISIIGSSGSGKSTLLNLIGLLDKPTCGNIFIDGKNTKSFNKKDYKYFYSKYIGYVFQQYNLFKDMSVIDNITLNNDKSINIDNLLRKLKIYDKKNTLVKNLSGGEMQRVAIARAMLKNPKVILADEPTGALDSLTGKEVMEILKSISKDILVIVVTHNNEYAYKYSDSVINIKDGVINDYESSDKQFNRFKSKKVHIKLKNILNIININFKRKIKRNILTIFAFMISLLTLTLVMGINNGFNKSLEIEEKDTLSTYPIHISETSYDLDKELSNVLSNNKVSVDNKVVANKEEHINKIDATYMEYINKYNIFECVYGYYIDNTYTLISKNNNTFNDIEYLSGSNINNINESILLLDSNNNIDYNLLTSIGLDKDIYDYEELVGYKYKLNKKEYIINGIYKINEKDTSKYISGIYYHKDNFKELIPDNIYLYAKDYNDKTSLKEYLDKYEDVYYSDYASTIKNLSSTVVNSISVILICFLVISFIVLMIMIGILSYISVIERIKEIGILKSLGYSNRNIKSIFYLDNLLIGYIAAIISLEIIDLSSGFINKLLYNFTGLSNVLNITYKDMLIVISIGLLLVLIGTFIPINRIKKYDIVDTLRGE